MLRGPHLTSLGSQSGNRKTPFYSNKVPTPALHDDLLIMMRMPYSRCAKGNHSFSAVPTRHETQIHPPLAAAAARVAQMKQRILHRVLESSKVHGTIVNTLSQPSHLQVRKLLMRVIVFKYKSQSSTSICLSCHAKHGGIERETSSRPSSKGQE